MRGRVFVEYDATGQICRIFRHRRNAVVSAAWEEKRIHEYPRKDAVEFIRKRTFDIAEGHCKYCGKYCSWEVGEMHEELPRGKGGEISIYNSVWSCHDCHTGPSGQHKARQTRFGETDGLPGDS